MPKLIRWGLIALGVILLGVALNTGRQYLRWSPVTETPAERADRLAGHWRLVLPDGPGPFPAAILLSGCDGVRDNMDYWAGMFVARGRAALILDSHSPRSLDDLEAWRLVCAGQALAGAERAGDIAVAMTMLSARDDIVADFVLLGASHGGWTAMEFVAETATNELPPGLTDWPAPPETLLATVSAVVLLYPYCGVLNGATADRWTGAPPTLFVLAENDTIIDTPDCLARAEGFRKEGASVEIAVLPGADHGFDQQQKSLFSTLVFDEGLREETRGIVEGFLGAHGPR